MAKCSQTMLEGSPDQTLTEEQKHGQCDICSYLIGTLTRGGYKYLERLSLESQAVLYIASP
jgi:hypothetical protein